MGSTISEKSLMRKLRMDKKINCVALVVSSWHYLNALATINYLRKRGKINKSIILVFEHIQAGFIADTILEQMKLEDSVEQYIYRFGALPASKQVIHYLKEVAVEKTALKNFFILRPVEPNLYFTVRLWELGIKRNFIHVIIDEGLGYYLRSAKGWWKESIIVGGTNSYKKLIGQNIEKKYFEYHLKKNKQLLNNTFFKNKDKELISNETCVQYLKSIIEQMSRLYDYNDYCYYENSLIICTQPFNDMGMLDDNEDIKVFKCIYKEATELGVKVIIKPHPRENNIEKYKDLGVVDNNNKIPLETIVAGLKIKPIGIIGITTTTLVTAKVMWGVNTFSVLNLINKQAFHSEVMEDINNFEKRVGKYVAMPDNYKDIVISMQNV